MDEVGGALVAIALVLMAVFVPTAFIGGISGQFYKQFALTIAGSTLISLVVSLTLSPALAALIMKPHAPAPEGDPGGAAPRPRRGLARLAGLGQRFNQGFTGVEHRYSKITHRLVRMAGLMLLIYLALLAVTGWRLTATPKGFIPVQDQGNLLISISLPPGADLNRTDAVVRDLGHRLLAAPGVEAASMYAGVDATSNTTSSSGGQIYLILKSFAERARQHLTTKGIIEDLKKRVAAIDGADVKIIQPPSVRGIGSTGGFKLIVEDQGGHGPQALEAAAKSLAEAANKSGVVAGAFVTFNTKTPRIFADIDRGKAEILGVPDSAVFATLQTYLGSTFINDFNLFGHTFQVLAQADAPFRRDELRLTELETRSSNGAMVPLGSLVTLRHDHRAVSGVALQSVPGRRDPGRHGAGPLQRRGARQDGGAGQGQAAGPGYGIEWTELAYQERLAGNTGLVVFGAAVVFVFLLLAALYESVTLPFAVILIVPMCLLAAMLGGQSARAGQQHPHPDRPGGADRTGGQERHPDRRIRPPGRTGTRAGDARGGGRGRPHPPAADPDDLVRLHLRGRAAGLRQRGRRRDAPGAGGRGVLRDDRGDRVRPAVHAGVLCGVPRRGRATAQGADPQVDTAAGRRGSEPGPGGGGVRRLGAWLCAAASLSACVVGPRYRPPATPIAAQGAFVATGPAGVDAPLPPLWWRLYQDPVLDALVRQALVENQSLKSAAANLAYAQALLDEAKAGRYPSTSLSAGGQYGRSSTSLLAGAPAAWSYVAGFTASYQVDLFGRIRRAIQEASANVEATRAAEDVARVTVAAATTAAYVNVCGLGEQVDVAERSLSIVQQTYDITLTQRNAGSLSDFDVARQGVLLEQARATIAPLAGQRRAALFALAALIGRTPAEVPAAAAACRTPPRMDRPLPVGDGAALLRRRPDIRQADRVLAAYTAGIGVATADLYPTVTLGGSVSSAAGAVQQLFAYHDTSYSLGPLITWSFPNVLYARAEVKAARAQASGALANFNNTVLTALQETEQSLATLAAELDHHRALAAAAANAEQALKLARIQYQAGTASGLDQLTAEATAIGADQALAASDQAIGADQVAVFQALGGGWEEAPPVTAPKSP